MSERFYHDVPKARVIITSRISIGGAYKKVESPLLLLIAGDYGKRCAIPKISVNKGNLYSALVHLNPKANIHVSSTSCSATP
jgi:predicted component of type VI protein secretion system